MKAKAGTPTPTKGFAGQGMIFSGRQDGLDYLNVQKQPTNYNTKSSSFTQMNEIVKFLDASYDALPDDEPPPTPSKQAWIDAANPYASVGVCGCKGESMSGKKFFRLVNWNIAIAGGALILYPAFTIDHWQGSVTYLLFSKFGSPGAWYCEMGLTDGNGPGSVTFNTGRGINNTQLPLDGANPVHWLPASDGYNAVSQFTDRQWVSWCLWNTDGVPAGAGKVRMVVEGP